MAVPDQGTNFVADILNFAGQGNSQSQGLNSVKAGMVAVRNANPTTLDDLIASLRSLQIRATNEYNSSIVQNGANSLETITRKNRRDAYGRWITAFNIYFRYLTSRRDFTDTFANWADRNPSFKQQRQGLDYPYGTQQSMESTKLFQELSQLMFLNAPSSTGNTAFINPNVNRNPINPLDLTGGGVNIFVNPNGLQTGGGLFDPFGGSNIGPALPTASLTSSLPGGGRNNDTPVDGSGGGNENRLPGTPVLRPCQNPRYWIKTTRGEDRSRPITVSRTGFGEWDIGYPCTIKFEIYRCCAPITGIPGLNISSADASLYNSVYKPGTADKVAEFTVTAKNASVHQACNASERFPQEGFLKGKGTLYYAWYFDFEEIIKTMYSALNYIPEGQRRSGLPTTLLSEIYQQLLTTQSPFVIPKNVTESNMCVSPVFGLRGTYKTSVFNSAKTIDTLGNYYGLKNGFPRPGIPLEPFDWTDPNSAIGRSSATYNPIKDAVTNTSLQSVGIVEALLIGFEIENVFNLHGMGPDTGKFDERWNVKYKDTSVIICKNGVETQPDCSGPKPDPIVDDCKKPWKSNGDMLGWWNFKEQVSNDFQDIEDLVNKDTYKNGLYESLTMAPGRVDGAVQTVAGKSFIFKGSTIVSKQIVRTEKRTIDRNIAGSDCWLGYFDINKYQIKRLRKHYIEVFCSNGTKVEYISAYDASGKPIMQSIPDDATRRTINKPFTIDETGKYVSTMVMQRFGSRNPKIETVGPNSGLWYIWTEGQYDIVNDKTGVAEFADGLPKRGSIELNKNGNCIPKEECKYLGWQLDTSNPCGCVDIEVYNCYNLYTGFTYYDEMGSPITVQDVREPKDFGNTYAKYMLPAGYKVTGEQPSMSPECNESSIKIYHPLLFGQDVIRGSKKNIMMGLFNSSQSLLCYHTSSTQHSASKDYYYEITDCDNCNKKAYYAVAYGNRFGSGSLSIGYDYSDSPSRAIYGQNKLLCLEPPETTFKFYNSGTQNTPSDIYVINFNRDGLSHRIDPGNFEINLAELSGSGIPNNFHTGSNVMVSGSTPKILRLIDNSGDSDDSQFCVETPYTSYDLVSGSIENGVHSSGTGTNITTYGKVYPNLNLLILDGSKLNSYLSFNSVSGSNIAGDNAFKLHTSISGAAVVGYPMKARNVREKTTNHYFIRIPSRHANYSTNPTFVTENVNKLGALKYDCFVENPVTYITSIGLYNAKRELLAIAKLSRPIQKSLENDVLIKIRLNW